MDEISKMVPDEPNMTIDTALQQSLSSARPTRRTARYAR